MEAYLKVEILIETTISLLLRHPNNEMLRMMIRNLELLKKELSEVHPDGIKIRQVQYGLIRLFEELQEFEDTLFGRQVSELLVDLNKY